MCCIVPKTHVETLLDLAKRPDGSQLAEAVLQAVPLVARILNVDQAGFRLINNCG